MSRKMKLELIDIKSFVTVLNPGKQEGCKGGAALAMLNPTCLPEGCTNE